MGLRYAGVGVESTFKTGVVPTRWLELLSEDLTLQIATEKLHGIREWSPRKIIELNRMISGTLRTKGNYQEIALMIDHLLGDSGVAGAGPYTHTQPSASGIPSTGRIGKYLSVGLRKNEDLYLRFLGCKLTSMAVSAAPDKITEIAWGVLGADVSLADSPTAPVYLDDDVMIPSEVTLSFDAAALDCEAVEINVEIETDNPHLLGSKVFTKEPVETGAIAVACSATCFFEDLVQYTKFANVTDVDVSVVLDTGGDEIWTMNMNKVRLTAGDPAIDGRGRLKATYEWEAMFDTTATSNFQSVLVNDQAVL